MLEPMAAVMYTILATAISQFDPSDLPVTILSGIIIFVPGLALTLGLTRTCRARFNFWYRTYYGCVASYLNCILALCSA
ncbi:hypothetical protein PEC18_34500 [Paucibacter sp. O1-1]|nr:hypothetical protein [Paucibacter sp. O1-1]MDA3830799.1 hypothetical protein [Paucibacter sp. O1-1]